MLVLSRQRDETIMIGDDIEVTVVISAATRCVWGSTPPRDQRPPQRSVRRDPPRKPRRRPGQARGPFGSRKDHRRRINSNRNSDEKK